MMAILKQIVAMSQNPSQTISSRDMKKKKGQISLYIG
jgi:hypothetical protein